MSDRTARTMIEIWEGGWHQSPVDRAVTILQAAHADLTRDDIAAWTVGTRDRDLLRLREEWFGPSARCLALCPACAQSLEFELDVRRFRTEVACPAQLTHRSRHDEQPYEVAFRLPDSRDMVVMASCAEPSQARALMLGRCVLRASRQTEDIPVDQVPAAVLAEVEDAMAHAEPEAEILLDLTCPDCQARWQTVFEIGTYLWSEIAYAAQCALWDVHVLARAYGWAESAILEMSEPRRRWYLEKVSA